MILVSSFIAENHFPVQISFLGGRISPSYLQASEAAVSSPQHIYQEYESEQARHQCYFMVV